MSSNQFHRFRDGSESQPKMTARGLAPSLGFADDLEEDCAPLVLSSTSFRDSVTDDIYSKSIHIDHHGSRFPQPGHHTKDYGYGQSRLESFDKTAELEHGKVDSGVGMSVESMSETSLQRSSEPDILQKLDNLHLSGDSRPPTSQQLEATQNDKTVIAEDDDGDEAYYSQSSVQSSNEQQLQQWKAVCQAYRQDEDGDTLLHMAVIQGEEQWALRFMSVATSQELLNFQNQQQQTPLHLAVLTDQELLVKALLAGGADFEVRDRGGNTALHLACRRGNVKCVRHLTTPLGRLEPQPLTQQLYTHFTPSLPTMIQDLAIKNYEGETCLHVAASHGHVGVLEYLVRQCGADINLQEGKSGRTVLHQAVESNSASLVQVLLHQPGLELDSLTYDSRTALCLATDRQLTHICQMLQAAGADVSALTPDSPAELDDDMMEGGYDDFSIGGQPIQSWT